MGARPIISEAETMRTLLTAILLLLLAVAGRSEPTNHDPVRLTQKYLYQAQAAEGVAELASRLRRDPDNAQLRYCLGVAQFVRAIERLARALYGYGLNGERLGIPFLRLPVPPNPQPESVDYPAMRTLLQEFVTDLQASESTLAALDDDGVQLPLELGRIRLNIVGEGTPLLDIAAHYLGGASSLPADKNLLVHFDRGDVAWFRGYSHLLMAQAQLALAYDGQELFDGTAHLFFPRPATPYPFLLKSDGTDFYRVHHNLDIVDVIALVHLIRLPVKEPVRMASCLGHLEQTLALSRETWTYILAETDDDHEWLPNPKQNGVLDVKVTREMIDGWLGFVGESQALLSGKRLVPFWRKGEARGVNLRRVFLEPRALDLALWLQGTAAAPYLQTGELTDPQVWSRLQGLFGGQFMGFALWFN